MAATTSSTHRRRNPLALAPLRAAVWVVAAANVALLIWILLTSLKTTRDVFEHPWRLPIPATLDNYVQAWKYGNFATAAINSTLVAVGAAVAAVALAAPAAYILSRLGTRSASAITLVFALGIGVPTQVILLPIFLMLSEANLIDNLLGLALAYIGTAMPFMVFLLTGFFRSLPIELEEAAAIDGTGVWRSFYRVILPVARPAVVTAFVLQLISNWNETMLALVLVQRTEKQTLPVALLGFIQQQEFTGTNWGGMFAGVSIVVLPMIVLFMWLGRRITEGLTVGVGK